MSGGPGIAKSQFRDNYMTRSNRGQHNNEYRQKRADEEPGNTSRHWFL